MADVAVVWMSFACAAEQLKEAVGVVAQTAETADDFRLTFGQDSFDFTGVVHAECVSAAC